MDVILIIFLNFLSVFYFVDIQQKYLSENYPLFGTYPGRMILMIGNAIVIGIVVSLIFLK